MRTLKFLAIIVVAALMTSCASTVNFPVSQEAPGAEITAKIKKQGETNYFITITANNLADSKRLNPPKNFYVIWAVSSTGVTRNVGYFIQENAVKSTYKASFPYRPVEIFITAEDVEAVYVPSGIEITRVKL